jgi:hypothetical protein
MCCSQHSNTRRTKDRNGIERIRIVPDEPCRGFGAAGGGAAGGGRRAWRGGRERGAAGVSVARRA